MSEKLKPRGKDVSLPTGGLPEVIPPYLQNLIMKTGGVNGPIGRQFVADPQAEAQFAKEGELDPLMEDYHEVAPGLVYKFQAQDGQNGRALWTITRNCAAYCRFCTRGREVGARGNIEGSSAALANTPHLSREQIDQALAFIEHQPGLNEIIVSGGDPLTLRPEILRYIFYHLGRMQKNGTLDIVRFGTRAPVHNPEMIGNAHIQAISLLTNPRGMIHINHPEELTQETKHVLERMRKEGGAILMSQTVLLRGVNDSADTLCNLFNSLAKEGIVPYYVFQNDPVYWAKHFTVPLPEAIQLWQQIRPRLSGVAATARFVIDVPHGYGKIPIPEGNAWSVDYHQGFRDFQGHSFPIDYAE
jgi:lysine 2,3-aminomutase